MEPFTFLLHQFFYSDGEHEHLLILLYSLLVVEGFEKFDNNNHHEPFNLRVHFHERRETHFPDVRLPITRWIVSGGNRYGRGPLRSGSPLCKPHPVQEESAFTVAVARSR